MKLLLLGLTILVCLLGVAFAAPSRDLFAQNSTASANLSSVELRTTGDVETPLTLTAADLKELPRKTLKVENPHDKKTEVYEGVPIQELLSRAGVPLGEKLRGAWMSACVVAEASDGYRVVFALAELDSGFQNSDVIIADTLDGAPLGDKEGPFKIVAPRDKRPA